MDLSLGIRNRITVASLIIILCFLTLLTAISIAYTSFPKFLIGLLLLCFTSVIIMLLLRNWEKNLQKNKLSSQVYEEPQTGPKTNIQELETALENAKEHHIELVEKLNTKNDQLHKMKTEHGQCESRMQDLLQEIESIKTETEEELRRKNVLLSEYQETINQQRDIIKKKQEQITTLESELQDRNYEVKTLLQLADLENKKDEVGKRSLKNEMANANQVDMFEEEKKSRMPQLMIKTKEEATLHLNRCIDIAQKITAEARFGNGNSRFKDFPIDSHALDLRRLFENLRSENVATVIVYSQKENKLLFANDQTLNLLGWSPENFTQNFSEIIAEGAKEWNLAISELRAKSESKVRMVMKAKNGHNILIHCHLRSIPTGAFRNHIIGVFYPG